MYAAEEHFIKSFFAQFLGSKLYSVYVFHICWGYDLQELKTFFCLEFLLNFVGHA